MTFVRAMMAALMEGRKVEPVMVCAPALFTRRLHDWRVAMKRGFGTVYTAFLFDLMRLVVVVGGTSIAKCVDVTAPCAHLTAARIYT